MIRTGRLVLEPLAVAHAAEMVSVLADPVLYVFTGGWPPTESELEERYRSQSRGSSPDGTQGWLNWVVRRIDSGAAVGFVQATLTGDATTLVADVAWVIGVAHQGEGVAGEAASAMLSWLARHGVSTVQAHIHPDNAASAAVAARLGLAATGTVVDGEVCWVRTSAVARDVIRSGRPGSHLA